MRSRRPLLATLVIASALLALIWSWSLEAREESALSGANASTTTEGPWDEVEPPLEEFAAAHDASRAETPVGASAAARTQRSDVGVLVVRAPVNLRLGVVDARGASLEAEVVVARSQQVQAAQFAPRGDRLVAQALPEVSTGVPFAADARVLGRDYTRGARARVEVGLANEPIYVVDLQLAVRRALNDLPNHSPILHALPLQIRVTRPGFTARDFELVLELNRERLASPAPLDYEAELRMPVSCEVTGRARAAGGDPRSVRVAAFEWNGHTPGAQPLVLTTCDGANERFGLELDCERAHLVVAFAEGFRPEVRIVAAATQVDLGLVVLERGESLEGRARLGTEGVRGLVRLALASQEEREAVRRPLDQRWVCWTNGRFEWDELAVSSDIDGRFAFHGLAPLRYRLSLGAVPGVYASDVRLADVVAPATALDVSPPLCRMDVRLFREGAPAVNAPFDISEVGASGITIGTHRTDASGAATLWLDPSRAATLALEPLAPIPGAPRKIERRLDCPGRGQAVAVRVDF